MKSSGIDCRESESSLFCSHDPMKYLQIQLITVVEWLVIMTLADSGIQLRIQFSELQTFNHQQEHLVLDVRACTC